MPTDKNNIISIKNLSIFEKLIHIGMGIMNNLIILLSKIQDIINLKKNIIKSKEIIRYFLHR